MPARTLEYNLATLSAQIRPPLEIVVVNGSPERAIAQEAADVCERYPLARCVNVLLHKFNLSRMFNIGIRASRGEYAMLTSVDQVFAPNFLVDVYRLMAPGTFLGSLLGQLPEGYDLGEPGVLSACWPAIVADAEPPLKFSPGGIICIQRAWLERVRGYDETRTPYNYCDADLTSRAKMDGLDQDVIPDWTRTLHVRHGYKDALYYGLGGSLPDGKLPIVRNTANWGQE